MLTDKHLEKQPVEKILFVVPHGILPKYILACKKVVGKPHLEVLQS